MDFHCIFCNQNRYNRHWLKSQKQLLFLHTHIHHQYMNSYKYLQKCVKFLYIKNF
ncbi:hypothetical protein NEILACOT_03004 [Neisseria lactamica ATCC 23970]|uniref:Uncharacterized protein n=1 Tax=Neisseria lactamica ATCC 23970 TaxID=546265 RepID=D0W668_NEILA|nr:hypothetical protein NEILACOT_03004 [Neisseria lactamica ATCC 23970]